MAIEDSWYDYYRGPAPSMSEKIISRPPTISTINNAPSAPLSPASSTAYDPHFRSDYAPTLVNHNVWRESDRKAELRAKHGRERQLIGLIFDLLVQLAGFASAIVFGIWAVKSYNVAVVGLKVQTVANQLSLRMMCTGDPTLADDQFCKQVLSKNAAQLWDSSTLQNPLAGTEISTPNLSLGGIVGVVIGSVVGVIFINIVWAVWRRRRLLIQLNTHLGTDPLILEAGHGRGIAPQSIVHVEESISRMQAKKNKKRQKKEACQRVSSFGTSAMASAPTPYSGNPLTPNGTNMPGKNSVQTSLIHQL
ncbi:hypothetical protein TWF694_007811 [Orbilia ellipsospora]|uniref:Uncharacterized protein n=1 Tax=Orbilia ellipsospora TaxID=2528407 RepID=A0AAV9XJT7_9PEZI